MNRNPLHRIDNDYVESFIKFFGISIDEHLSWQKHLSQVKSKIAELGFLSNNLKHILSHALLRNIYIALFHPQLVYGYWYGEMPNRLYLGKEKYSRNGQSSIYKIPFFNGHTHPVFRSSQIFVYV